MKKYIFQACNNWNTVKKIQNIYLRGITLLKNCIIQWGKNIPDFLQNTTEKEFSEGNTRLCCGGMKL